MSATIREKKGGQGVGKVLQKLWRRSQDLEYVRSVDFSLKADSDEDQYGLDFDDETGSENPVIVASEGWKLVRHSPVDDESHNETCELGLESYRKHFYETEHKVFATMGSKEGNPIIAAATLDGNSSLRILIWTTPGVHHFFLRGTGSLSSLPRSVDIVRAIAETQLPEYLHVKKSELLSLRRVRNGELCDQMLKFEAQTVDIFAPRTYKIGVLYVKSGQKTESEFFGNQNGSLVFEEFLTLLGDSVKLLNFRRYAGGLDTDANTTGTHSVYTVFEGCEIMFHVSTLLPYSENDSQQVQRKRHIGNDICVIVFIEGKQPYNTNAIRSSYNHVICTVRVSQSSEENTEYMVDFASKTTVPTFGPLMKRRYWRYGEEFKLYLLRRLINGQRAALSADQFSKPVKRYRSTVLNQMVQNFSGSKRRASAVHSLDRRKQLSRSMPAISTLSSRDSSASIISSGEPTRRLPMNASLAKGRVQSCGTLADSEEILDDPSNASMGEMYSRESLMSTTTVDEIPEVPEAEEKEQEKEVEGTSEKLESDVSTSNPGDEVEIEPLKA
eukprot:Colp12_sorted_trinity150504_noHs@23586